MVFKFFSDMFDLVKIVGFKMLKSDTFVRNITHKMIFFNGVSQDGFLDIISYQRLDYLVILSIFSHRSNFSNVPSH